MQKKLIALAVAGLVSAPAFAQSNVQIYGVMDLGFRHLGSSESFGGDPKLKNRSGIDHSGQVSSRLGFRGTEDLGNGLKAFFTVEQSLSPDTTAVGGNRQAFLGLEGGFGRVWMGRDFNPSRAFVTSLDPFGSTGIGNNQQIMQQTSRYDNAIMYRTPSFGGLTVAVAYSNDIDGDEPADVKGRRSTNSKGWSVTPIYKNGPLTVGGGYERYGSFHNNPYSGVQTETDKRTRYNLGGSYNFGVADVRLVYSRTKNDLVGGGSERLKTWMLAAVVPVSEAGSVLASYNRVKVDGSGATSGSKANQIALGYSHNLSKRTAVYATYARISTNSDAEGSYSLGTSNPGTYNTSVDASYTRGFNVGIRHNF